MMQTVLIAFSPTVQTLRPFSPGLPTSHLNTAPPMWRPFKADRFSPPSATPLSTSLAGVPRPPINPQRIVKVAEMWAPADREAQQGPRRRPQNRSTC